MYSLLSLELNQLCHVAFLLRRSAASCGFARETNSHHMPLAGGGHGHGRGRFRGDRRGCRIATSTALSTSRSCSAAPSGPSPHTQALDFNGYLISFICVFRHSSCVKDFVCARWRGGSAALARRRGGDRWFGGTAARLRGAVRRLTAARLGGAARWLGSAARRCGGLARRRSAARHGASVPRRRSAARHGSSAPRLGGSVFGV